MQGLIIQMPTLASVALLFYKGGFYGSAHVQATTLGYISILVREVLEYKAHEVAAILGISTRTVES